MISQPLILFCLLGVSLALLVHGRLRHDFIAFAMLLSGVLLGVVPAHKAFEGFGHPATVVIAVVLIVSRGLSDSGALAVLAGRLETAGRSVASHIGLISGIGAALSAVMNNVAALALLMPVDIKAAEKAKRSPALTLMPLSFATILGGLVTLIGTPPNIVIATYREKALGAPFGMFDFTPVGLVVAAVGVSFVALLGWRLVPAERGKVNQPRQLFEIGAYLSELKIPEKSKLAGKTLREIGETDVESDVQVLSLIRNGRRVSHDVAYWELKAADTLVVEGEAKAIEQFAARHGLEVGTADKDPAMLTKSGEMELIELVVPPGAYAEGRSAASMHLLSRWGVQLIGVARRDARLVSRVRDTVILAGDVLLLYGPSQRIGTVVEWLGGLLLAGRGLSGPGNGRAGVAAASFAAAIALASLGVVDLPVALGVLVLVYVAAGVVTARNVYASIEWPIVVLVACFIPVGAALETSGGTALLANGLLSIAEGVPASVVLLIVLLVAMTLSDVLNSVATALIMAPVSVDIAGRLGASPDPFLMAVAIGSSCAFLTPIGHKNNMLVMGPGGYRFSDYWRMGLPLELLIVAVALPMILLVWPL